MKDYRLAEIAYEAYRKQSGGKSLVSGQPIPSFSELKPEIQEAWYEAAGAVGEEIIKQMQKIYGAGEGID